MVPAVPTQLDAPLYADAQAVRDAVEAEINAVDGGITTVSLDLDANDTHDITSADQLDKLADVLDREKVRLAFVHVHQPASAMMQRPERLTRVGDGRVFPTIVTGSGASGCPLHSDNGVPSSTVEDWLCAARCRVATNDG